VTNLEDILLATLAEPLPRLKNSSLHSSRKTPYIQKQILLSAVPEHAEELDIHFVYLPPYCPQFIPIELVWKSIKHGVSGMFILERYQLIDVVRENFMKETRKTSYLEGWMKTFF